MMIVKVKNAEQVESLFAGWEETMIWSCLQGVMGEIYAPEGEKPPCAMAILGDFSFYAGEVEDELIRFRPKNREGQDFLIMTPRDERWAERIEQCYGEKVRKVNRYAIQKEPDCFDREKLKEMAERLPEGYTLQRIDERIYDFCGKRDWCRDLVSQYPDYETYQKYGLGVVAIKDGEPISGASSYTSYRGGIEIEIDTHVQHRRKGLALACGARLIQECLDRGLYPSWDAQNLWSVALAEKLGYHYSHTYTAYETV